MWAILEGFGISRDAGCSVECSALWFGYQRTQLRKHGD